MKKILLGLTLLSSLSFALNLETLLEDVKQKSNQEVKEERERLDKFISQKEQQRKILKETKAELKREEARSKRLKKTIDTNEKTLETKERELKEKAANLGEMFGSVRQTSADFLTNYQNSLTASEDPKKLEVFEKFANSKKLPNTEELTLFWHTMLDEIIKSGSINQYEASIILNSGEKVTESVTRVGQFVAVSDGRYLNYSSDMKSLVELSTTPANTASLAKEFENSSEIANIIVDPTRGTLFEMLESKPTFEDRIKQGGIVGYVIIALGIIGLLFALYRIIVLNIYSLKIKKQRRDLTRIDEKNSLGKVAKVFYDNLTDSLNELEIKVGEAILKESNKIRKGQSLVKLLAAVTPLLGLLGTVTGMIATFQAITLFGTGDPKLMAGGISTALITTVLGLVTAIPLLFAYTYISSKAENLISIIEEQSVGLLAKNLK